MSENIIKTCGECGEPSVIIRDGIEVQARCSCDWQRGFLSRMSRTVHGDFWNKRVLNMGDWSPSIFKGPQAGAFHRLIKVQKVRTVQAIYNFCYQILRKNEDGSLDFAMKENISRGRNLYIRGPNGSGRGLLVASIKMLCAMKDISTTPLPCDFSVFKSKILESEAFGKEGEEAKSYVESCYGNVSLLTLEDLHGEYRTNFSNREKIPVKARVANGIDSLLARRLGKEGSILMTSSEFAGEISVTLGDKLFDILDSDRTKIITMFDAIEAEQLLKALRDRHKYFEDQLNEIISNKSDKKKGKSSMDEAMGDDQKRESIKEGFYFGEAFKEIPGLGNSCLIPILKTGSCLGIIDVPEYAKQAYNSFLSEKEQKGHTYYENIKWAQVYAVRACSSISKRMSDRELSETGKMLSVATSGRENVTKMIFEAKRLLSLMRGKEGIL